MSKSNKPYASSKKMYLNCESNIEYIKSIIFFILSVKFTLKGLADNIVTPVYNLGTENYTKL